jgi:nitrite reductase/ring-hydroxylating ferredoxin subunit
MVHRLAQTWNLEIEKLVKIFSSREEASIAIPKGSLKLLILNGKKIALAHTDDGFSAFDNACPHQFEPLHKGGLNYHNQVVCRLHNYRFNIKTGQEVDERCHALNIYPVLINESGVHLNI